MTPPFIGISLFLHLLGNVAAWLKSRSFFSFLRKKPRFQFYSSFFPLLPCSPANNFFTPDSQTMTAADKTKKTLAVLIPAHNEETVIAKTINSAVEAGILLTDIYVIDNCSTDSTSEITRQLGSQVLKINEKGKAKAIRAGLEYFQIPQEYNWVQIVDADSAFDKNYFKEINSYFQQPNIAAISGQVKSYQNNLIGRFRAFEYTVTHDIYRRAQSHYNIINVIPGPASCFNTKIFQKINFESDTLTEDMDFTIAIHRYRLGRVVYCPRAIVKTQDPLTLKDYYKQIKRWYSGLFQVIKKRRLGIKPQWIDIEVGILTLEGLWFSTIFLSLIFIALFSLFWSASINYFLFFLALDATAFIVLLTYATIRSANIKILLSTPYFYLFRCLNALAFLQSFILVFVFRHIGNWNKVKREIINTTSY